MIWIRVFLSFGGRLDREQYIEAFQILSFACWLPALLLYWSDVTVRIAVVFLLAIWPWLALAIKRLRDSGRSARLAFALILAWLFAGACLLAGNIKMIDPLTTIATFAVAVAGFCLLQEKVGQLPPRLV